MLKDNAGRHRSGALLLYYHALHRGVWDNLHSSLFSERYVSGHGVHFAVVPTKVTTLTESAVKAVASRDLGGVNFAAERSGGLAEHQTSFRQHLIRLGVDVEHLLDFRRGVAARLFSPVRASVDPVLIVHTVRQVNTRAVMHRTPAHHLHHSPRPHPFRCIVAEYIGNRLPPERHSIAGSRFAFPVRSGFKHRDPKPFTVLGIHAFLRNVRGKDAASYPRTDNN